MGDSKLKLVGKMYQLLQAPSVISDSRLTLKRLWANTNFSDWIGNFRPSAQIFAFILVDYKLTQIHKLWNPLF